MRYMLDTNIFVYMVSDPSLISRDVESILSDYDNQLCVSVESVRELVVAFNRKGLLTSRWKTAEDMVRDIEDEFFIQILPVRKEHMLTYSRLRLNDVADHKDPSDHVIISHAMTERMPLISSDRKFVFYRKQGLELVLNER